MKFLIFVIVFSLWAFSTNIIPIHADAFVLPTNGIADYSVPLAVSVQESPPQITLSWPQEDNVDHYTAECKTNASGLDASSGEVLTSTTLTWTYANVVIGHTYECAVYKFLIDTSNIFHAIAYGNTVVHVGIKVPLVENRGKIILITESSVASSLSSELETLTQDLVGDGWTVITHNVSSTTPVADVKGLIVADYNADPTNVKSVFLFGHVPVPYSGYVGIDGHVDHVGAWPADLYYADFVDPWTDTSVNLTDASDPRNWNIPGDGKFDQYDVYNVALQSGRVDLSNMPAFAPKTEVDLLRQYLAKDHAYRFKTIVPLNKGLISDNMGILSGEAPAQIGWRNFSVLVGPGNITSTTTDYLSELASTGYLWTLGDGGGTYTSADGIGTTNDFVTQSPRGVFNELFGSYFGDWDTPNNILRAPLASDGWGLIDVWGARPTWDFRYMGLGETIGAATIDNGVQKNAHMNIMGDPTLRQNIVAPPSALTATPALNVVTLNWTASPDPDVLGYYLYRATNANGPFTRVTDTMFTGISATDTLLNGDYTYMVRAVKLETTASGSYYNASQGIFASTTVDVPIVPDTTAPSIPTSISTNVLSSSSISLSWATSTDSGTSYGDASGVAGYIIYENGNQLSTTTETSFTVDNLLPSTTYNFSVSAYDNASNTSETSSIVSATTKSILVNYSSGSGGGKISPTSLPLVKVFNDTPAIIPGCNNGKSGFSVSTGQSCANNIIASPVTNVLTYNFGTTTLKNGSKGEEVKELQRFLNKVLDLNLVVDGKLGSKTIAVIKRWQRDHGLVADGLVGVKTKTAINAIIQ